MGLINFKKDPSKKHSNASEVLNYQNNNPETQLNSVRSNVENPSHELGSVFLQKSQDEVVMIRRPTAIKQEYSMNSMTALTRISFSHMQAG